MAGYYPIVYVRGYAMTQSEVESTFNMPYYGFNLGSTQFKLAAGTEPKMHIFESPVVRLIKEEDYQDSFGRFVDPRNRPIANSVSDARADWRRTLWIFRYYDPESRMIGEARQKVDGYAADLAVFLNQVRLACGSPARFAVILVAHSMGGLVARSYLQNPEIFRAAKPSAADLKRRSLRASDFKPVKIHKLFTYATPHRGIGLREGLGWAEDIRDLIGFKGSDAFGSREMRRYLNLARGDDPHTYEPLAHAPPIKRVFSLVGTNFDDYVVGSAKLGVGPGSDGLVTIENAYVKRAPRAFVHRSHSGPLGIVNSEAGYENLRRFLFGNVRFRLFLRLGELIEELPGKRSPGDQLDYFLVELNVTIRGLPSYLHTRSGANLSAIRVPAVKRRGKVVARYEDVHLFTGYLNMGARLEGDAFARGAADIRIEPHYRHDGWMRKSRYEGDWVMNDRIHFGVSKTRGKLKYNYRWSSENSDQTAAVQDEMFLPLPASTARYLRGGSLRALFDEWS
ncbi:MAG: hypothetical protein BMS9Abin01_1610 [Gammaproteobacteria bacterium]|nr:MAG: hypothetical protein BMS9Abin01_1610 [Gammaproteobacteria bacterium]